MKNVGVRVEEDKLILEVDLSKDFGPSKSGKTHIVGTSSGPKSVPGKPGYVFGVNVYVKPEKTVSQEIGK